METQTNAKKDVYAILTEKVVEKLKNGIVPWQVSWTKAGIPENLVSNNAYRGINRILLACLGYARNLFLTSNQLKTLNGAILPDEKPHIIAFLSDGRDGAETQEASVETGTAKKKMSYYTVFNIAQCKWPDEMTFREPGMELDQIQKCVEYKAKDQKRAYYDPLQDFINLPAEKHFPSKEQYCYAEFHQLMHSTGHYSRLNRKELIQMPEFGYDAYSHEELVAEIGASYLMSHFGLTHDVAPTKEYFEGWIKTLEKDRYLLFSAAYQAEKAISFLFLGDRYTDEVRG